MKGRLPTPTAIKRLRGNPGRRPIDDAEPHPELFEHFPRPPKELNEDGRAFWMREGRQFWQSGCLTRSDVAAFTALCRTYARYINFHREVERTGYVLRGRFNDPVISPFEKLLERAHQELIEGLREFGGTPVSRVRVKAAGQGDAGEDKFEAFLRRGPGTVEEDDEPVMQ